MAGTIFFSTYAGATNVDITDVVSFADQDSAYGGVVSDGITLGLTGNHWQATTRSYDVSADTVLEFEFMSNSQGEIHGIGLDENDSISPKRIFQLYGTQSWGALNEAAYTTPGKFQTFRIPVGRFYTGDNMQVVFVNDKDAGVQNNTSFFRNVRLLTPDETSSDDSPVVLGDCTLSDSEEALLAAHNAARAEARDCGLQSFEPAQALKWNCTLGELAVGHSTDMAANNIFSHSGSDGLSPFDRIRNAGYRYRAAGENIAAGYRSIDAVVNAWLSSPGHCSNIMNPDYTELGAARVNSTTATYPVYWTSIYARPQ